jgi:hypothetical protein
MADNQREAMLEALKNALEQVPGVRYVDRQAITEQLVSDHQMPAIIIDEDRTEYTWMERHGTRTMRAVDTVGLDCQVLCQRGDFRGNVSTVRQAFAWQVMNTLANASTLGDACKDAALRFAVRYPETDYPYARVIIGIVVDGYEVFDEREQTVWQKLTMQTTEPQDGPDHTFDMSSED